MNIVKTTEHFESWLGKHIRLVKPDLKLKHLRMKEAPFPFMRATFYRWMQLFPEVCSGLANAPAVLAVGDLHVENFGTWRDIDGRLVWGINDFDEAAFLPYTIDLVRLAASALLAAEYEGFSIKLSLATDAILEGYENALKQHGRPFILEENNKWLRQIATSDLRDPVRFWQKMDKLPAIKTEISPAVLSALKHVMPAPDIPCRYVRRIAGLGSLGHQRIVAIGDYKSAKIAREAKALSPSAVHWAEGEKRPTELMYGAIVSQAVRCPDPFVQVRGSWLVRRLSPHCSRIELADMPEDRDHLRLLSAMGSETANIHLGTRNQLRQISADLRGRKRNWLLNAAKDMAQATQKDWKIWRDA